MRTIQIPGYGPVKFPEYMSDDEIALAIERDILPPKQPEPPPPPEEKSGFFRQLADVPVGVTKGAVQGVRFVADAFGANNPVSNALRGAEDYLGDLMSAQAKNDQKKIAEIMKEAEDKGVLDQVVAGIKAFTVAPVDLMAQAFGTVGTTLAGGLAANALKLAATGKALTATGTRMVQGGIGSGMGAGIVKGEIYDAVKQELINSGVPENLAEERAQTAQSYGGENLDQILLGAGLGFVASSTGAERILSKIGGGAGARTVGQRAAQVAAAGGAEAVPEFFQGAQEQLAQNIALQREGFDVPTMRGVVGSGTLEGLAGLGVGAGAEAITGRMAPPPPPPGAQGELFTEEEAPIAPVPEDSAYAQREAEMLEEGDRQEALVRLDSLRNEFDTLQKENERLAALAETTQDPEAQALILSRAEAIAPALEQLQTEIEVTNAALGIEGRATPAQGLFPPAPRGRKPRVGTQQELFGEEETTPTPPPPPPKPPSGEKPIGVDDINKMSLQEIEDLIASMGGKLDIGDSEIMQMLLARRAELLRQKQVKEEPKETPLKTRRYQYTENGELIDLETPGERVPLADVEERIREGYELNRQQRRMVQEEAEVEGEEAEIEGEEAEVEDEKAKVEAGRAALPEWRKLSDDERQVYVDGLSDPDDPVETALTNLINYRNLKGDEKGKKNTAAGAYEVNRDIESRTRDVDFPAWNRLTPAQRQVFTDSVPTKQAPTYEQQQAGFDALENALGPMASRIKRPQVEAVELRQREIEARRRAEKEKQAEELSLKTPVPSDIVERIKAGDTKSVIDYLKRVGIDERTKKPIRQGKYASPLEQSVARVKRLVAGAIGALDLNTKIVYVDTDTFIADYDPRTDTIRVSNRGFDDVALLHELVHAATVRVVYNSIHDGKVTAEQKKAVARLINLKNEARKTLGSRYSRAFVNTYEFIAYAMSDPKFQQELQQITLPQRMTKYSDIGETSNFYTAFVELVADAIGLFNRYAKAVLIKTGIQNILKKYNDKALKNESQDLKDDAEVIDITEEDLAEAERPLPAKNPLINKAEEASDEYIKVMQKLRNLEEKIQQDFEKDFKKATGKDPKGKDFDSPPGDMLPLQKRINNETNKLRQEQQKAKSKVDQVNKELKEKGLENFEIDLTEAEKKSFDAPILTPGYLGNMFLEVAGIFDIIIDAPPEDGIPDFKIGKTSKALPIAAAKKAPQRKPVPPPTGTPQQRATEKIESFKEGIQQQRKSNLSQIGQAIKNVFSPEGGNKLIELFQNDRNELKRLQEFLDKTGKLVSDSAKKFNNIATQIEAATGISFNNYNYYIKGLKDQASEQIGELMRLKRMSEEDVLAMLQGYMTGLHEAERRHELFLRLVPLKDTVDAATARKKILERLYSKELANLRANPKTEATALSEIKKLKKDLEAIVADPKKRASADPNLNNERSGNYDVLNVDYDTAQIFKTKYQNDTNKKEVDAFLNTLRKIDDVTKNLNSEANYYSAAVKNVVDFYGFKNYFPFKGKAVRKEETLFDLNGERLSGDYQEGQSAYTGRQSDATNPALQVLVEATRSAARAGHKNVPIAMKNIIDDKVVFGKLDRTITFAERNDPGFRFSEERKENTFFVYQPDGSIQVYEINDPKVRFALKRAFKPESTFSRVVDVGNKVTSFFGQMHTRYNPAFAPLDFTRNLFTYSGIISAKYGPRRGGQVLTEMAKIVGQGGMAHKTVRFSWLFSKGNQSELNRLAKTDPYYADLKEYFDRGGRVSYVQGLTAAQSLEELGKKIQPKNGVRTVLNKEQLDTVFDAWLGNFELTTRVAAFRVVREQLLAEGKSPEEAAVEAVAFAKDLANFEQMGQLGKELGAMYMFFRPTATGAVRAIKAILPAFDRRNEQEIKQSFKNQTQFGGDRLTAAELDSAYKKFDKERQNARRTGYVITGIGAFLYFMAYTMAGEDDEGRNKTATDDMERWIRFARFNTGIEIAGRDLVFQLPWGFGLGAFAAAGAQMMSVAMGNQNIIKAADNIMEAGFESFMPIPTSGISKAENPTAYIIDSLAPSSLRPLVQYTMNVDGLGRQIYAERQSRYADAFLGGDNVPAIWSDTAKFIFKLTNGAVDFSPNALYFFANNYLDGATRVMATTYNLGNVIAGEKDFDPRTDAFILDSYLKAPSNYDAKQFSQVENKIRGFERNLKALESSPDDYLKYVNRNPLEPEIVDFYNTYVNGELKEIREAQNQIRRMPDISIRERQRLLQLLTKHSNLIKMAFVNAVEDLDVKP